MPKARMSGGFPRRKPKRWTTPRAVIRLANEVKQDRALGRVLQFLRPELVLLPRVDVTLQEHLEPDARQAQVFLCESVQERGPDGYLRTCHVRSTDVTALWKRYVGAAKLLAFAKSIRDLARVTKVPQCEPEYEPGYGVDDVLD